MRLLRTEMAARNININYPMNFRVYLTTNLEKKMNGVVGLCDFKSDRTYIYLDKDAWERMDYVGREMLMFHELGHCALDLEHNRSMSYSGEPLSLMFPTLFDPHQYSLHRAEYIDELAQEWMELYAPRPQINLDDLLKPQKMKRRTFILRPGKEFMHRYRKQ